MVKVLLGLVAAVVIAVGGFFGFEFYTQHRIAGEVETAFEQIRASGGKASHGKVSFDLKSRTLRIADIATESATQPPMRVNIANLVATGVGQTDTTRFSADTIEATDVEINASMVSAANWQVTYKVPHIAAKDFSGPASLPRPPASSSMIELYRFLIEQVALLSASSITAPSVAGTMNSGSPAVGTGEFAYSGVTLRDIKAGKIAAVTVDRLTFSANSQAASKAQKTTGDLAGFAALDIDVAAVATVLDPQRANDDGYHRVYRQITTGAYTITGPGPALRIGGLTIDDIGVRPARLQLPALLAAMPSGTAQLTPAQAREIMQRAASIYDGIRIGNAEMRELSMDMPEGGFKLAAIRFSLDHGKTGEFAIEGLDGRSPNGPFKVGRFALKSLDIAGLMRMAAQFSPPGQPPSPDKFLGMLPLLAGIDVKGVAVPFKNTGKPLNFEVFNLDWGQFVGPIPSKVRLVTKFSGPLDGREYRMLLAAGMDKMAMDFDLGAAWDEASRSLTLEPGAFEISGLVKMSAHVSLTNVQRQIFSIDPMQSATMAAQVETGAIDVTLRDLGVIDLAVAEYARTQNVSRDAARQAIAQDVRSQATNAGSNQASVDALARFIETSRTTMTLKLTPLGKVPAVQLFRVLQTDPFAVLSLFRIEASTAL